MTPPRPTLAAMAAAVRRADRRRRALDALALLAALAEPQPAPDAAGTGEG